MGEHHCPFPCVVCLCVWCLAVTQDGPHCITTSKAAYDFFHGGEALAQLELQEYGLGDHRIDEALSDDRAVVITRPDGSAVVSYRGTDHMSDLAPDFQIALGYHHNPLLQSIGTTASQWAGDRFADARSRFSDAKRNMDV